MSEKLLTDYSLNENLFTEITSREVDPPCYDAFCSYNGYIREEFTIFCKHCNTAIAKGRTFDGYSKDWSGPRIDKNTVCPKCKALLFDEKAVVIDDKINNNQNDELSVL